MRSVLLAAVLAMAIAGCTEPAEIDILHVHGLAYDGDAIYVATHHGLAKGTPQGNTWSWSYVGDPFDYMGFTQDAERTGVFYTSGHPDKPADYGAAHLGLRRSVDGGHTWEQRSLKGEVDFHALTSIPGAEGWLAGYWKPDLKVSTDGGVTWTDHDGPPDPVGALAGTADRLLASTAQGIFAADLETFDWTPVETSGLPSVVPSLVASHGGQHLFASAGGSTYRSLDGGATWSELAPEELRGQQSAVHFAVDPADPSHVFASTFGAHVMESHDAGATWKTVREG